MYRFFKFNETDTATDKSVVLFIIFTASSFAKHVFKCSKISNLYKKYLCFFMAFILITIYKIAFYGGNCS